jgi:hypothetical protein
MSLYPRGAERIIGAMKDGKQWRDNVVITYVGPTNYDHLHIYPEPGKRYDWRFLLFTPCYVVVRPGIDAQDAVLAISECCAPYACLVDVELQDMAYVLPYTDSSGSRLWRIKPGSDQWLEWFGEDE